MMKINDLIYTTIVDYGGINSYHQFARVENVSKTGKLKISIFPSIRDDRLKDIVHDDRILTPVKPNMEVVRQIKMIQANGYQSDLECFYYPYNPDTHMYDTTVISKR